MTILGRGHASPSRLVAGLVLLGFLGVGGCGSATDSDSHETAAAPTTAAGPASPAATDTDEGASDSPAGHATGDPKTDPCSLLTKSIAEKVLGTEVGSPTTTPGEGNVTCAYSPADGRSNVLVLLTTYAASGKAALASATQAFPDATAVSGLGDAALVSRQGHAIGVSQGDLLFGMSVLTPDSLEMAPALVERQLVDLARAVLESR
jgi:hypothetical protein